MNIKTILAIGIALLGGAMLSGCENNARTAANQAAVIKAEGRSPYVQKNDIEFSNYDKRQKMSDDPSTIVWCTFFPPTPGTQPITIPVVGKLTSGGKRVFRSHDVNGYENVGPDGMFGSSGEYRYGFTPGDNMVDIYNLPSFCTTEPTVWQRAQTEIIIATDSQLSNAAKEASSALKRGNGGQAYATIRDSIQ